MSLSISSGESNIMEKLLLFLVVVGVMVDVTVGSEGLVVEGAEGVAIMAAASGFMSCCGVRSMVLVKLLIFVVTERFAGYEECSS